MGPGQETKVGEQQNEEGSAHGAILDQPLAASTANPLNTRSGTIV